MIISYCREVNRKYFEVMNSDGNLLRQITANSAKLIECQTVSETFYCSQQILAFLKAIYFALKDEQI